MTININFVAFLDRFFECYFRLVIVVLHVKNARYMHVK